MAVAGHQRLVHAGLLGSAGESMAELVRDRDPPVLRALLLQPGRWLRADGHLRRSVRTGAAVHLSPCRQAIVNGIVTSWTLPSGESALLRPIRNVCRCSPYRVAHRWPVLVPEGGIDLVGMPVA